jgi:hypothetical protein
MSERHLHITCAIIEQDSCVLAARRSRPFMPVPAFPGPGLQTFASETGQALTFGNFVQYHEYEPERLLVSDTWTGWKARANLAPAPSDPDSPTGQNLVHHQARGYTILVFARPKKKHNNCTVPFVFLGPARHVSHQKERPIQMVWQLSSPMPVEMFEENRRGG